MSESQLIAVVPAAGAATRLPGAAFPKELLPVALPGAGGPTRVVSCIERTLALARDAGADRAMVVVSTTKPAIVAQLGDGSAVGIPVGYVVQTERRGLWHSVAQASPWWSGSDVLLVMPDTVIEPQSCGRALVAAHRTSGADLTLAAFETARPTSFGMLELAGDDVVAMTDKPASWPHDPWMWGLAVWRPRVSAIVTELAATRVDGEVTLDHVFRRAREERLRVCAHRVAGGVYHDLGTPQSLRAFWSGLAE